jgi:hypothetical protein
MINRLKNKGKDEIEWRDAENEKKTGGRNSMKE